MLGTSPTSYLGCVVFLVSATVCTLSIPCPTLSLPIDLLRCPLVLGVTEHGVFVVHILPYHTRLVYTFNTSLKGSTLHGSMPTYKRTGVIRRCTIDSSSISPDLLIQLFPLRVTNHLSSVKHQFVTYAHTHGQLRPWRVPHIYSYIYCTILQLHIVLCTCITPVDCLNTI